VSSRSPDGGVLCALVTPFGTDGAVDERALGALIEFQIERGSQGLFVLGTLGEGLLCTPEERMRVAELCRERVAGRVPLVLHCGAADTGTAARLVEHAAGAGVGAVAAIPPLFFPYDERALYDHFARLVDAGGGSGLEHYVYDNPERVGFALGVPLVTRLVDELEPIVGVKDTGDSLGKMTQYLAHGANAGARAGATPPRVFTGNNLLILPALVMGAQGGVSALANAAPELFRALHDRFARGQLDDARRLQLLIARLHATLAGVPYIAGVKHLVTLRGLPGGRSRAPLPELTSEQAQAVERRLAAEDDLREWLKPVG
jgi:dihydrodipicolinate synthase/N-acetylneuraminate lyase